jgi:phage gpG-like protein
MALYKVQANVGDARAILERARALAMSMEPFMEEAGSIVESSVRERFRTGKGPGGIPWPPSNRQRYGAQPGKFTSGGKLKTTKASRDAIGPNPGGRTLVDTGGLESSITYRVAGDSVTIGFIAKTRSAKYAYVHQFGATILPRNKPYLAFKGPDARD